MKTSNIIVAVIILIFISLLTISITRMGQVPIVNVKAEVSVAGNNTAITVVNLEQDAVNPIKAPRGNSNTPFPSVDAQAIINDAKLSYWASNPYEGNGTYDLMVGFSEGAAPKPGDIVKVVVYVHDVHADPLAIDMGVLLWK